MNQNFMVGANLALQAYGIKNERERQSWMQKLYQSQLETAGLQREHLGLSMEAQRLQIEEAKKVAKRTAEYGPALVKAITPSPIIPGFAGEDIGITPEFYRQRAMGIIGQYEPTKLAEQFLKPPIAWHPTTKEEAIEFETTKAGLKEKVPSMGNAVELAVFRKFKDASYITDPQKSKIAAEWLDTTEGGQAVEKAMKELTPTSITYLQTGEGFVPAITKGKGIGEVGQPTGLGKPFPSEMVVTEQQIGTLKETLDRVKVNYDPSYVGFVSGRVGKIGEKIIGVGEKQSKFYSDLAQLRNTLIYLYSGKQINENEYKRLTEQLPIETMPESTFKARMENFELTLESIIKNRRAVMGGYGKSQKTISIPSQQINKLELTPEEEEYAREQLKKRGISAVDLIGNEIIKKRGK